MNAVGGASSVVFYQLAFWPPDREVVVSSKRSFAPRLMARMQILELHVLTIARQAVELTEYPCTYPGCARGMDHPFESSTQLANHRFAAHGIRSTNEESIKRQERRDKQRAKELGKAPEYIDPVRIREQIGTRLAAPAGLSLSDGPLNPGEREYLRRRLAHFVGAQLPREIRRAPAEICLAVAEIAASALEPTYPKIVPSARSDVQMERLTQLFTKNTALAAAATA